MNGRRSREPSERTESRFTLLRVASKCSKFVIRLLNYWGAQ